MSGTNKRINRFTMSTVKHALSRLPALGMLFCCMLLFACGGNKDKAADDAKKTDTPTVTTPPPAAPVVISPDDSLRRGVTDAVKDYPGVSAAVNNGEVTLTGDIQRSNLQKLMMSLHSLKPRKINNNLTIK